MHNRFNIKPAIHHHHPCQLHPQTPPAINSYHNQNTPITTRTLLSQPRKFKFPKTSPITTKNVSYHNQEYDFLLESHVTTIRVVLA